MEDSVYSVLSAGSSLFTKLYQRRLFISEIYKQKLGYSYLANSLGNLADTTRASYSVHLPGIVYFFCL